LKSYYHKIREFESSLVEPLSLACELSGVINT
jgi:hypothetical protein